MRNSLCHFFTQPIFFTSAHFFTVDLTVVLRVDLRVDPTVSSESVKVSRGQLRSVLLNFSIHQTAGNMESYMWDEMDGIGWVTEGQTH